MPTQCGQGKCVCGIVRQIKSALEGESLVASIGKALAGGLHQSDKLCSRSWFSFELPDPGEVVEFLFAHGRRSSSEPKTKIFG
jgi:hypothetical protein